VFLLHAAGASGRLGGAQIPMAALVAVMIMVSIGTFNWASIRNLREHPRAPASSCWRPWWSPFATHDLAKGVLVGVLLSGFFFAHKVGRRCCTSARALKTKAPAHLRRHWPGVLRLGRTLCRAFDFKEVIDKVRIDVSRAHFWDITAVSALDKVVLKFRREGTEVEVIGLNEASATMVDRFAVHDKPGADER
jgi:SulP family sulfate permease